MTDDVDDFLVRILRNYQEKEFRSASGEDLGLEETEEEKQEFEKKADESKDMLSKMTEMLGGRVKEVRLSHRLKSNPVCLAVDGDVSIEMEKVLNSMPTKDKVQSQKVLELNPDHPVFQSLVGAYNSEGYTETPGLYRASVRSGDAHRRPEHRRSGDVYQPRLRTDEIKARRVSSRISRDAGKVFSDYLNP